MNDTFSVSLGQAQQLEFALARNGWTKADVHEFCKGDMAARVLPTIRGEPGSPAPNGLPTEISTFELERLRKIERDYIKLCEDLGLQDALDMVNDLTIKEVFTQARIKRLGFHTHTFSRFHSICRCWEEYEDGKNVERPIKTLRQLARVEKRLFLLEPNFGKMGVEIIEAVLAEYGLCLGMQDIPLRLSAK